MTTSMLKMQTCEKQNLSNRRWLSLSMFLCLYTHKYRHSQARVDDFAMRMLQAMRNDLFHLHGGVIQHLFVANLPPTLHFSPLGPLWLFVDHCEHGIACSDRIAWLIFCSIRIHQCSMDYGCKCKRKSDSVPASTMCANAREDLTSTSPTIPYP